MQDHKKESRRGGRLMGRYIRREPMSAMQAEVMKIVRAGGCLRLYRTKSQKCRVLDKELNPVMNVQERVFIALKSSQRIKFDIITFSWIHNNKRIINPDFRR